MRVCQFRHSRLPQEGPERLPPGERDPRIAAGGGLGRLARADTIEGRAAPGRVTESRPDPSDDQEV